MEPQTETGAAGACVAEVLVRLADATTALARVRATVEAVAVIGQAARALVRCDAACVFVLEGDLLRPAAADGVAWGEALPLRGSPIGRAVLERRPTFVEELAGAGWLAARPVGLRSALATPLGGPRPAGALVVAWAAPHSPTPAEAALARILADAAGPALARTAASEARVPTVLLVDDEELVRRVAARVLSERGLRVVEAASGEEALGRAAGAPIDLLVTDVAMPRMTGHALADALRAAQPSLKVLFTSGYGAPAATGRGDTAHLEKPYTGEQLAAAVDALLGRS